MVNSRRIRLCRALRNFDGNETVAELLIASQTVQNEFFILFVDRRAGRKLYASRNDFYLNTYDFEFFLRFEVDYKK